MRATRGLAIIPVLTLLAANLHAGTPELAKRVDAYLIPYVESNNFSGAVLVKKQGKIVFQKAYGQADRERHVTNRLTTQFHIASVSMQFTAAAVLRLVDQRAISLDTRLSAVLPELTGAEKITIRDLLLQRSGLPDINELPDYGEILQHHQTASSLVKKIEGRPLVFEPGSKYLHEEHSAYNVLARVVEIKTGAPFAAAVKRLVFRPAGLSRSGVDDDSSGSSPQLARGYAPDGVTEVKTADTIHWSAKTGNASVYTTALDEARWVDALFSGRFLNAATLAEVTATSPRVGYGWFRSTSSRFGKTVYYMNGRAPGFASYVAYLPDQKTTVVVLSNIYSSATSTIGNDLVAIALGLPYEPFQPRSAPPSAAELKNCTGRFRFGPDFYQANAETSLVANGSELSMRWPSGQSSVLIPLGPDHFVDRSYWEQVRIERDSQDRPAALMYGSFRGPAEKLANE